MIKLDFEIISNVEFEALRLLQTYWQVLNGFYIKNRFIVLPELVKNSQTIFFPRLSIVNDNSIKEYLQSEFRWDEAPVNIINLVESEIESSSFNKAIVDEKKKDLSKWISENSLLLEKILSEIFNLDSKLKLKIVLVSFGSWVSFSSNTKDNLIITLRSDMPIEYVGEGIVTSMAEILIYGEKHEFTAWQQDWEKNEYLVDFLLKHTQIANLIPQYQGTLQTLKSYELGEYAIESKKYLEELGFFTQSRLCKIEGKIQIDSNIMSGLTKSQFDLLSLLIEKRNQLVTFDEIGKVLWQNDFTEKYSPWAIAKHIQGLREKLRLVGLNSNSIQTYRKQGVVLYD